ncbi:MAG: THUMP domain-containing protein [Porphyromonadaceae bacterium]|nr:THUMP domain-containing protein [Porphyromonadaceae bacterium]
MPADQQFRMIAKTLHALEDVLAREIEDLGGTDVEIGTRMVSFTGDKALLYKANLRLRTALRILKPIYTFRAKNPDELYSALREFDWQRIMRPDQTFSVDTTVYSEDFTHSKFVGYRTKDAIVDYFRERSGSRPSVRLDNPDIYLNVHIAQQEVTLSLDSSGESLHKRGYRAVQTDAPINEVLAAGILLKAGWNGETDLIDPMCGSGTFLIEAALIARNIAPGIYRSGFAFERWMDYDQALFNDLYNDDSLEREFTGRIIGSDILPNAVQIAQRNVARAGLGKYIDIEVCALQERPVPSEPALIVMNPPYGERLRLVRPEDLYAMIGERLKHNFAGCTAWVIAYKREHFDSIGLRPNSRTELMNGALACELRSYELFSGKRDDFQRERPRREHKAEAEGERKGGRFERKGRRTDRKDQRPGRSEGQRKPYRAGKEGQERRPHKANERTARPDRPERKPKKALWPSDRFRIEGDEVGSARRKPKRALSFQVLKSED